jgi:hypothetical protein
MRLSVKYKLTSTDVIGWGPADFSSAGSATQALRSAYSPI